MTDKLTRITRGLETAIVSDSWLDKVSKSHPDLACKLVTAENAHRVGVLDAYVCWSCERLPPATLTYESLPSGRLRAVASID